ncbi:MAG TPA: tetratricopeptide repeat protein [Thermoanaerobaculia bacterium]|jgi:tetratricopeptide (TPR) repeat protein|nr:tetratricopeptide repeat protein [Thermoanaerobaculia bacterium]
MPYTLNGIGTHYYGGRNRSARVDVCKSCNRSATLSSYDTREWICVLFIPLIPLTKYRIIDDCSSCRKHHRMSLKAFGEQVESAVAPLREAVRRSPSDPQPHLDLVTTLVSWEMRDEARKEIEIAAANFPRSAEVHVLAGQLAVERADWNGALPFFERAKAIDPQNVDALYGQGWLLHQLGRDEEAIGVLQRVLSLGENRGALYLLGISQSRTNRWSEALQSYQRLLGLEPAYANDKPFLRLIAECKRHVGYELTDAERRASRRWWPFGSATKKAKHPAMAGPSRLVRPALVIPGLIVLALAIGGGVYNVWDSYTNNLLFVDNGLPRAVQVELDGKKFDLGAGAQHTETLDKGTYAIVIRESDGKKEIERMRFEIRGVSILDAIFHERFFVYNVASSNVYRRSTHGYAVNAENSTFAQELVAMQRFFEQRDVDYEYTTAPETIRMDAGSKIVNKVAFNIARDFPLPGYALMQLQNGRTDEAQKAIQQAVANAPCDSPTRQNELYIASFVGPEDAPTKAARQWIADCAAHDLEAHRAYQQVATARGHHDALLVEYQQRLAAAPESATAHYLVGRIAHDPAIAVAEHTEAVRLDPEFVWPHVALGYVHAEEEHYDDALREFATALDMPGHDEAVIVYYASAAIAKGRPALAVEKVDQALAAQPKDFAALHARWMLAIASAEWVRAAALQTELAKYESPAGAWWRRLQLLRFKGDPGAVETQIAGGARAPELSGIVRRARVSRALELGHYPAATAALLAGATEIDPSSLLLFRLYTAGGLIVSGDAAAAAPLLDKLSKEPGRYFTSALIAGMNGSMPVDRVMKIATESNQPGHGWFVAGVRAYAANDRARASECFAHALRASSDLDFPYFETKKVAELITQKRPAL